MNQDNGGVIGKINTPTTTLASGVWSLDSQFDSQSSSIWPLAFPQTTIANACRFNNDSADYLSRTPSSQGDLQKSTFSYWVKRSSLGEQMILTTGSPDSSGSLFQIYFESIDTLHIETDSPSLITNRKFRDTAAWYHILVAVDTTQSTSSDRIKLYINGTQETSFSTEQYPSQNANLNFNKTNAHYIGTLLPPTYTAYYDGYMAEVIQVDGQQLLPTSFGAFNPVTNIWEPIAYAGTYGTNGFRLDFADSSALGNDVSGNDNDFTVNNLTSVDQSTDTCSNNFATMNPLDNYYASSTFSEGNLRIVTSSANYTFNTSTLGASTGKWYCEVKVASTVPSADQNMIGISDTTSTSTTNNLGAGAYSWGYHGNGTVYNNGSSSSYGSTYTTNDIIGIALDLDNNKLYFSKNGTWQNSGDPTSGATGTGALSITASSSNGTGNYFIACGDYDNAGGCTLDINFGSPPYSISSGNSDANGHGNFEYSVPSGYYALNTKNLAEFG